MGDVVSLVAKAEEPEHDRVWARQSTFLKAVMFAQGWARPFPIMVRNLSCGGLMAAGQCGLDRGSAVTVELGRAGIVPGVIAWIGEGRFGIAFDSPIAADLAQNPVARQSVAPILKHEADCRRPGLSVR